MKVNLKSRISVITTRKLMLHQLIDCKKGKVKKRDQVLQMRNNRKKKSRKVSVKI